MTALLKWQTADKVLAEKVGSIEVLAEVEAGSRPMPTLDELLAELPVLAWPN